MKKSLFRICCQEKGKQKQKQAYGIKTSTWYKNKHML